MTGTTRRTCKATCKNGQPCMNYCITDSEFCFTHDPKLATKRALARKAGGKARHGRKVGSTGDLGELRIETIEDIRQLIETTINETRSLEMSLNRARTIVSLASVALKVFDLGELAERIKALEERMG